MEVAISIVVSGVPGSGKTTLALPLAAEIQAPLLNKDTIHETLFDSLGLADRESSLRVGKASVDLMYALARRTPLVVLDNFWRHSEAPTLSRIDSLLIQIYCRCPPLLAMERYRSRAPSRHRAHFEEEVIYDSREVWFTEPPGPLDLPGPLVEVNTEHPVELAPLVQWVQRHVEDARLS